MRAVFCAVNSKYIHSSLAPWCLAAGVRHFCRTPVQWEVFEATINQSEEQTAARLIALSPSFLTFSTYIWNISYIRRLLPMLRLALPDAVIVLGGPEASFHAEELLRQLPQADYILCGEGERSLPALIDCLNSGQVPEHIPGLCCRGEDGVILKMPPELCQNPPSPYCEEYFRTLNGRIAYLETSRGCPFSCAFCLSGKEEPVRFFALDEARQNLIRLANSGAKTVKLVDRTFNCNPGRAKELIRFLIGEYGRSIPQEVCFHFEVAADLFDDEALSLIASAPAGLMQFEAGLQSFHEPTLQAVTRKTSLSRLCRNLKKLIAPHNVHVHIDLIAGLPYETLSIFSQSFDKAYVLSPQMLQLGFLKLLYGSRLRAQAGSLGIRYSPDPPYEVLEAPWITQDELRFLHRFEDCFDRLYNSGRFSDTLRYVLKASGMRPFELFSFFCDGLEGQPLDNLPLDEFTGLVLNRFSCLKGVDAGRLRDIMVCDRLASNRSGRLPSCLRVMDPRLKQAAGQVKAATGSQMRRGIALLYHGTPRIVCADYTAPHPVTGRYPLHFSPFPA